MNTTNTILTGDCLTILPTLPDGLADLVYLVLPFNIGLDYPGQNLVIGSSQVGSFHRGSALCA